MAVTDWDNLTSITREKVLPKIYDQIGKDQIIFNRLWKPQLVNGGTNIDQVVKFKINSQGKSYSGLEVLNATQETTRTRARWDWRQLYQPIVLSNLDLAKNKGEGLEDLLATEMEEMKEALTDMVCTQLHGDGTGNGSKDLLGLIAAVDDGTNVDSYCGIVRTTYTWWKSYYLASAGAVSLAKFATAWDAIMSGKEIPTFIDTTKTVWTKYEALLTPQARYNFTQSGYPKVDGGFDALMFRTAPIVADEYCPSGYAYFLNEKYIKPVYLKHVKHPTDKHGFAMRPLEEPKGQDGQVGYLLFAGNVINVQPRRSGAIRGLT